MVQLEQEDLTFLYRDAATLYFMHPATFESIELPVSTLDASQLPFLTDNATVRCTKRGRDYIGLTLSERVRAKVVRAEGRTAGMKGMNDGGGGRRALLENGVWIDGVPNSVDAGSEVVVNTATLQFVSKAE